MSNLSADILSADILSADILSADILSAGNIAPGLVLLLVVVDQWAARQAWRPEGRFCLSIAAGIEQTHRRSGNNCCTSLRGDGAD